MGGGQLVKRYIIYFRISLLEMIDAAPLETIVDEDEDEDGDSDIEFD